MLPWFRTQRGTGSVVVAVGIQKMIHIGSLSDSPSTAAAAELAVARRCHQAAQPTAAQTRYWAGKAVLSVASVPGKCIRRYILLPAAGGIRRWDTVTVVAPNNLLQIHSVGHPESSP